MNLTCETYKYFYNPDEQKYLDSVFKGYGQVVPSIILVPFRSLVELQLIPRQYQLLQHLDCQRISCNSNRLQKGCESNGGDQLTRALKKQIQIFFALIQVIQIF